jgi:glycosyl transferase family 25
MRELRKTGMDYEIITAVDGRDLDPGDSLLIHPTFLTRTSNSSLGSVGAALSHLSVYRKIIADDLAEALILEDDVILPADIGRLAEAVGGQLVGAEVALLSVDTPEPCKLSSEGAVTLSSTQWLALPIDAKQPMSAGAYIITREACERLIKSESPVRVHADSWWFFYREGAIDRLRCVTPLPVLKNPKFASTIGVYSLGNGVMARLAAPIVRGKIPVLQQLLAYRRQRIYHSWSRTEIVNEPFIEKPSRLE